MTDSLPTTGLQLHSTMRSSGELELSLVPVAVDAPGEDEVVVRIEAAPINPSDLALLIGPADAASARETGTAEAPVTVLDVPAAVLKAMASRLDEAMPVGNEGAGVVVAAGASPAAQALLGKTVAVIGGAMFSQYRTLNTASCMLLPDDASAADGASSFVNPLTALSMVETMRMEGHTALVHTAAASNLGQMLNRVCLADGVELVNIVRSPAQVEILRKIGAKHIVDSSADSFLDDLTDALAETGATLAFDAIGGGKLAGQILVAMETAINRSAGSYSRYGSSVHKQVYIYGMLDNRPTELGRAMGMAWGVGGWLLTPFLGKIGREGSARLRQRVAAELKTTFASHYVREISLAETLKPEIIAAYNRRATGEKYLINPAKV